MEIKVTVKVEVDELAMINEKLDQISGRLDSMATQEQVDALAARLTALGTDLAAGVAGIRSDIEQIKAAHPDVNLAGLEASVDALAGRVGEVQALDAENPGGAVTPA